LYASIFLKQSFFSIKYKEGWEQSKFLKNKMEHDFTNIYMFCLGENASLKSYSILKYGLFCGPIWNIKQKLPKCNNSILELFFFV
jgi:hypothetical protein